VFDFLKPPHLPTLKGELATEEEVQIMKQLGVPNMAVEMQLDMEPLLQTLRIMDKGEEAMETLHLRLQVGNMVVFHLQDRNTGFLHLLEASMELLHLLEVNTVELHLNLLSKEVLPEQMVSQVGILLPLQSMEAEQTDMAHLLQT
jgi:hypothetical protein